MNRIRYIWPSLTPCPHCTSKAWWSVKTEGATNHRKCRTCGKWFAIQPTHEEVEGPNGTGQIRAVTSDSASTSSPAAKPAKGR